MLIILDTTAFSDKLRLDDISMKILFKFGEKSGFNIGISEVVYLETLNQAREEIVRVSEANNKRLGGIIQKLGLYPDFFLHDSEINKLFKQYKKRFDDFIKESNIKKYPIPKRSHKSIIERDLARKKPFNKSGKGYRDALIWETIIDIINTNPDQIVFISNNTEDFYNETKDGIHKDLKFDILETKHPNADILLYKNIYDFVKDKIIPTLPSPDKTYANLVHNNPNFDFDDELCTMLTEKYIGYDIRNDAVNRSGKFEQISIDSVGAVSEIEFLDEKQLSSSESILTASCTILCEFNTFIYKSDFHLIDNIEELFIWDNDWNSHYYAVSFSDYLDIEVLLTIDTKNVSISDVELIDIVN